MIIEAIISQNVTNITETSIELQFVIDEDKLEDD